MSEGANDKLWGGRFEKALDRQAELFNASILVDKVMLQEDIMGSIAHCQMLHQLGVLSSAEQMLIIDGLKAVEIDLMASDHLLTPDLEDIHMAVESLLTEKIGPTAKKLHTGRSRNDQVATDFRLYVLKKNQEVRSQVLHLIQALLVVSDSHRMTLMPGYTHLQKAQPITLGYHLLAYVAMLQRDYQRLTEQAYRTSQLPLGSGAIAGVPYASDRQFMQKALGFEGVALHAMDAISDRDFVLEGLSHGAILQMHLSRLAEELILWSSSEYRFITLSDQYCTGSSLMPQKKNPDVAELIRGKTGRIYGNLMSLLTTMKALPMAYNKDLQEDKEPFIDTFDTLLKELPLMTGMVLTATYHTETMASAVKSGYLNATDLADYLVTSGVPFRAAHELSGIMVASAEQKGLPLEGLTLEDFHSLATEWQGFSQLSLQIQETLIESLNNQLYEALDPWQCVYKKKSPGSTHPLEIDAMIRTFSEWLQAVKK